MKLLVCAFLLCAAVSACGADGEPVKPQVSGAVTISNSGIYPSVGVSTGPVSIFLGL